MRRAGSLVVEETTIAGVPRAVQCKGDGALQDVRMLQGLGGLCFWFKVEQKQLADRHISASLGAGRNIPQLSPAALKKRKVEWDAREWNTITATQGWPE